ncbi:MAG: hypothetical protein IJV26_00715, partial [Lachnospiraceae bacterium]|nr:hypothetical protein [Lachnospiraceae bacterium]
TAKVTDENGNDVTDQFAVSLQSAELRILPAPLTIRTGSAQKAYDGTALTAPETEITGLQGSDQISVLVTGTQTVPGSTENTCEISWGETKPSNYQVELQPGTLQVSANAAQVVLRAADASKTYDGTELIGLSEVTAEGLPAGFSAEIETEGSLTDAGTASNHITGYVIYNAAGEDNSSFFTNVQTMDGVLRILPRKVTITSASAEKVYDGKELTTVDEPEQGITVSGDGFAEGEGAEYIVTGTQTLTGMSPNTFSYTLAEGTAAGNYEITQSFGTLTVKNRAADEKYQITAQAAGGRFTYDGTAHTAEGLVTDTFTVDGQTYTLEGLTASRTERNAGDYEIALSGTPLVRDADGNDVTEEFAVSAQSGLMTIEKRSVVLTSADAEKEYDGTALTTAEQENAGITVTGDGFAAGEGAEYTVTGAQTVPGESENTFTYRLTAGTEAGNYDISVKTGTLKVTDRSEKIHVTLQTSGASTIYDGTAHTVQGLVTDTITVDGVVYTITGITCEETQTDAGTYPVKAEGELKILDADGNDVTDQFDPEILEGSLQILPRELVLKSADAQKEYDGTALTTQELENTGITISGDGFAAGEGFEMKAEGSQLLPGSSVNSISYAPLDGTKEENYRIRVEEGTLTVTDRVEPFRITVTGNSGDVLYDGAEHSVEGLTETEFRISGRSYTVEGLEAAVSGTDAGTYTGTISGTAKILDADGNDVTGQFVVTGTAGTLQIRRRSLVLTSADAQKVYDGSVLTTTDFDNGGITVNGDGFAEGEGAVYTVTGSQTLTGTSGNIFTYQLNEGTKAENYDIVVRPGLLRVTGRGEGEKYEIIAQAADLEAMYDGKLHEASGLAAYEFTIEGTTYTVEGLSAVRLEKNAGTYEINVTGTPVVRDAAGNDVSDQFMVRTKSGTLTIAPRTVILTSADAQKEYDGTPLTTAELENAGITVSGDGFADGEGAQFTLTASRTLPGAVPNTFRYVLNHGTLAQNYAIEVRSGTLTVADRVIDYEITLVPKSRTYEYDGESKVVSGFETLSFEIDGQTYTVSGVGASAEGTDAGTYPMIVTGKPVVSDADGSDVTKQFELKIEDGALTIEKQQLTMTSASDSREYDGTPLRNAGVRISGGSFADGEGAEYEVTGTQTVVGSSQNTFTYRLKEGTKEDNYDITVLPGTLTIRPRESRYAVTIRAQSAEKTYDGQELAVEGLVTDEVTVDGVTYHIEGLSAQAQAVSAGSYPVAVTGSPIVRDAQGNDVTDQFAVTAEAGELVIHPRTVILTSADEVREYDGSPLTGTSVTVSGDGFAEGEGADFFMNAERVLAGETANTFTYNLREGTDEKNYRIETVFGKLIVLNRGEKYTAVMQGRSLETVYNGQTQSVEGFISQTAVVNGRTYQISGVTQRAAGVDAGVYPAQIEGTPVVTDAAGRDVTDQFDVTVNPGRLVIGKREVLLRSATVQREYDGTELTADTVAVEKDGFAEGEGADYEVTGVQTITGSSRNTFSYTLKENTNADNYHIEVVYGTLAVINRNARYEITVQAQSAEALYDGQAHTAEGFERLNFEFGGKTFEVRGLSAAAEETDAGTYPVQVTG